MHYAQSATIPPHADRRGNLHPLTYISLVAGTSVCAVPVGWASIVPLPAAVALATCVMLLGVSFSLPRRLGLSAAFAAIVGGIAMWLFASAMQVALGLTGFGGAFLYFFVLPLGVILGALLHRAGAVSALLTLLVAWGLVLAPIALVEHAQGWSLFGYQPFVEGGFWRATAGQFHPIILGVFLATALAAAARVGSVRVRALVVAVLLGGIWSTGSAGPLAIAAILTPFVLFPRWRRISTWTTPIVVLTTVAVAILSTAVWSTTIIGSTSDDYSNNYRYAIYALLPSVIRDAPFGFGPNGLPSGLWLINSQYLGVRDVSITVDAEPVLLATEFGVIGLAAFVVIVWVAGRAVARGEVQGLALGALTLCGLAVAIHSWISLALLWAVLIGLTGAGLRDATKHASAAASAPPLVSDSARSRLG